MERRFWKLKSPRNDTVPLANLILKSIEKFLALHGLECEWTLKSTFFTLSYTGLYTLSVCLTGQIKK